MTNARKHDREICVSIGNLLMWSVLLGDDYISNKYETGASIQVSDVSIFWKLACFWHKITIMKCQKPCSSVVSSDTTKIIVVFLVDSPLLSAFFKVSALNSKQYTELPNNYLLDDNFCHWLVGLLCKCVLPAALDETKVCQVRSETKTRSEGDKKKLRSQSSRFESSNSTSSSEPSLSAAPASRSRRQRRCIPPSSSSLFCSYPQPEVAA